MGTLGLLVLGVMGRIAGGWRRRVSVGRREPCANWEAWWRYADHQPPICLRVGQTGKVAWPSPYQPSGHLLYFWNFETAQSRCQAPGLALEGCPRAVWVDVLSVLEGQARRPVGDARGQGRGWLGVTVTGH